MKTQNRVNRILVLAAALALLGWGLGATDDKVTIGLVDLDQAITSTNEGRAAREEFDRKKRQAEQKLIPLIEQYREQLDELEREEALSY